MRTVLTLVAFLAAPAPLLAAEGSLATGGFTALDPPPRAEGTRPVAEPAPVLLRRLLAAGPDMAWPGARAARPKALGDALVVSVDDGASPVGGAWESALRVSEGPAGPQDAIAVRFPARALAKAPPFGVGAVIVGLDDWTGVATYPVELWLEDSAIPLQPRQGGVSASMTLDAAAAGMVASGGFRPTEFRRLRVAPAAPLGVPDAWLSDGAHDDAFDAGDGPLADVSADWLECGAGCGSPLFVDVVGGSAVRQAGSPALLLVKRPAEVVEVVRPALDVDGRASVIVRDGNASFVRAGLLLRAAATDAYYSVEYIKAPPSVEVRAVLPAPIGVVSLATYPVLTPSPGFRTLEATVAGGAGPVTFDVRIDGQALGSVADPTYRIAGTFWGLIASDPASSGETWDDFRVERRPDVFAVVGFPPGGTAALPLDRSADTLHVNPLLATTDGAQFDPMAAPAACANPGTPYVQLEVHDTAGLDRLFEREAHVVSVSLSCPTCRQSLQDCPVNYSQVERLEPVPTVGEPLTVSAGWWNERLDGLTDPLLLRASLWAGPCAAVTALIDERAVALPDVPGQPGTAAFVQRLDLLTATPLDPGPHCVMIEEYHDVNGDCCPDGREVGPLLPTCGGPCVPVAPTDENPTTAFVVRDLLVLDACDARGEDVGRDGPDDTDGDTVVDEINLDGASLRVSRGAGDEVDLTWSLVNAALIPGPLALTALDSALLDPSACFPDQAPLVLEVVGYPPVSLNLPPAAGVHWLVLSETDCPGGVPVLDAAADDPALGCP